MKIRRFSELDLVLPDGETIRVMVKQVVLAGYSGRTSEAVALHKQEMLATGAKVPESVPLFYDVLPCLLTQNPELLVVGPSTQAEVEFVLVLANGQILVTVGDDHFDLEMEQAFSAERSKNVCQKAIGSRAWPLQELESHWDSLFLELSSGGQTLQRGSVAEILPPQQLLNLAQNAGIGICDGLVLFSGTVSRLVDFAPVNGKLALTLVDPVLDREIGLRIDINDITSRV